MPLPRALNLPPVGWTLAGVLALYTLAGLFGHDPWKSEDVVHLAVARHLLDSGPGSGLLLAGQSFFHAPLYYWSAALTGFLFSGFLPLHDALRLASGGWMALTLLFVYCAAREHCGKESAAATPLLLAGSFGLIVAAHEAQPLLALLAAVSLLFLASGLLTRKPGAAAALLAASLTLAAAAAGAAGLFLLIFLLLPCLALKKASMRPLLLGTLGSLPLLGLFALMVALIAPEWFQGWIAREAAFFSAESYANKILTLARMLPLFSWPLLPLVCWSLWQKRRKGQWREPAFLIPLMALALIFLGLPLVFPIEEHTAMLLLPPLAFLATPGALTLRRGAASAFDWFSGMTFSVFALLSWLCWCAMVFGWPQRLAERSGILNPGFIGAFEPISFLLALGTTLWWVWLLAGLPRSPYRCLTRWTLGFVISWLLAVSLLLPWIDYSKSYRQPARDLSSRIPKQTPCVAEYNLGLAQRASFDYFEDLAFTPLDSQKSAACRLLLTQNARPDPTLWEQTWEGARPGDRKERFRLYQRRSGNEAGIPKTR